MNKIHIVLIAILAFLMIGSECIFGETKPRSQQSSLDRSTPGRTLESLAYVYTVSRNIDDYKRLLSGGGGGDSPSAYAFYFDPNDVGTIVPGSGYQIPQSWTYQEDTTATNTMFNGSATVEKAADISLDILNTGQYDDPSIPGNTYTANNVMIQLYLWPHDESFAYLATGPCDFEFVKVGDSWLIKAWYDRTGGS